MRVPPWLVLAGALGLAAQVVAQPAPAPKATAPTAPTDAAQWRALALQLEGDLRDKQRKLAEAAATVEMLQAENARLKKELKAKGGTDGE